MILRCTKNYVGFSQTLTVLIYYLTSVQCFEYNNNNNNNNNNNDENYGSTVRNFLSHPYIVGEQCLTKICSPNEYCDENKICQCRPGFKNFSGHCFPCSGDNEMCTANVDCCPMLICFGGVCRKGFEPFEFFTIFKICLGITIVSVIVVVFALLLRGLLNVKCGRWFRRNETTNPNPQQPFMYQFRNPTSISQETIEEKPPSYEECIKSSRNILESPPPYVISTNASSGQPESEAVGQRLNATTNVASVNPSATSVNIQALTVTTDICFNPALNSEEKSLQCQNNLTLPKRS